MSIYNEIQAGEIRICYDDSVIGGRWYAKIPLVHPGEDRVFRRLEAEASALEVTLGGPSLLKANPRIIAALRSKGISTTTLRIKPYERKN